MKSNVGIIVGRFQTPYLHAGHIHLIDEVKRISMNLLILISVNPGWTSKRNPMDFETRKLMLQNQYPSAVILPIVNHPSDVAWSQNLDQIVQKHFPDKEPTLYGSRDCFFSRYHGQIKTFFLPEISNVSATDIRRQLQLPIDSEKFREGVVYAATRQNFPTSFQVVDIIIRHSAEQKVLVGRKKGEDGWRFPGGFVDPKDESLEFAAKRETIEEVGDIEVSSLRYLASRRINDFRYVDSEHKMLTALFVGTYIFGPIKGGDDLPEVRWQNIDGLLDRLVDSHKPLAQIFLSQNKQ
jgi:bifunctional NMN adenylyltransferase/nudix hydrolase